MENLSLTIGRVRGAPIRAHISLLLVFFVALGPALTVSDPGRMGFSRAELILWSSLTAFAFLGSILLHELGHVFQGTREGMEVQGVTLWVLGGVAYLSGGTPSPGREFRVAAAGPLVTAILAVVLGGASLFFPSRGGLGMSRPVLEVIETVGRAQILLLAFNLIPAYPLDGGRMFLAALWRFRDNLTSASRTASAAGKAFGLCLLAAGALTLLSPRLAAALPGALQVNSLGALIVGFFIWDANRSALNLVPSARSPDAGRSRSLVVADFMNSNFVLAEPRMTVGALLSALGRLGVRPVALIVEEGRPLGMISKHTAEQVPEKERDSTLIEKVMVAKEDIRTVRATDPLSVARRVLEDGPETAVVLNEDVVVGIVSVSDIAHAMVLDRS